MNIWIYHAFREIVWVDEVIYCILRPAMSSTHMEIALWSDSILRVATGAANMRTLSFFSVSKNALFRFSFLAAALCTFELGMTQFLSRSDYLIDTLLDR